MSFEHIYNYKIIKRIDLWEYDHDIDGLHDLLSSYKNHVFLPEEKIAVVMGEQEYFYLGNPIGFTSYNLFRCWYDLGLPWHALLYFTNNPRLPEELDNIFRDNVDRPEIVKLVVYDYQYWELPMEESKKFHSKDIKYSGMCLLGTKRFHRELLFRYLDKNSLFGQIRCNFNTNNHKQRLPPNYNQSLGKIKNHHDTNNHDIPCVSSRPHRIEHKNIKYNLTDNLIDLQKIKIPQEKNDPELTKDWIGLYQQIFFEVVTESEFDCPAPRLTEKTFRPMLYKTPFVFLGPAESLKWLKSQGFKTFSDFWDESYDNIENPYLRFESCCAIINDIANLSITELAILNAKMDDVLEYNRNRVLTYINQDLRSLFEHIGYDDIY